MLDLIKLQKVSIPILLVVFFVWIQFWLHLWFLFSPYKEAICNHNGPFGIALPPWIFVFGAVVVLGGILFLRKQSSFSFLNGWPFLLILAGGLSNILERLSFGCIMDYIAIFSFPVFNMSDVALTVGAIGVVWQWWREERTKKKSEAL